MPKLSGSEQVAGFFAGLDHPLKDAMGEVRELILGCDETITEQIKWKAPSFCHNEDDRITFNLQRNGSFLLIFHRGAKVKDSMHKGRLIDDQTGLLEWHADDRASLKFTSLRDVREKRAGIQTLVRMWIAAASK